MIFVRKIYSDMVKMSELIALINIIQQKVTLK